MLANVAANHSSLFDSIDSWKVTGNVLDKTDNMSTMADFITVDNTQEQQLALLISKRDMIHGELKDLHSRLCSLKREEWEISTRLGNYFKSQPLSNQTSVKTTSYPLSENLMEQLSYINEKATLHDMKMNNSYGECHLFDNMSNMPRSNVTNSDSHVAKGFIAQDFGCTMKMRFANRRKTMTPARPKLSTSSAPTTEKDLDKLELDYAVLSQLYEVNKSRAIETKRDAYKKAYKANAKKLKQLSSHINEVKSSKSVNDSADSLISTKSRRLSYHVRTPQSSRKSSRQSLVPLISHIWPFKNTVKQSNADDCSAVRNSSISAKKATVNRTSSLLDAYQKNKISISDSNDEPVRGRLRSNSFHCQDDNTFKVPFAMPLCRKELRDKLLRPSSTALCTANSHAKTSIRMEEESMSSKKLSNQSDNIFCLEHGNRKEVFERRSDTSLYGCTMQSNMTSCSWSTSGCSCLSSQSSQLSNFVTKSSISTNTWESCQQSIEDERTTVNDLKVNEVVEQSTNISRTDKTKRTIRHSLKGPIELSKAFRRRLSLGQGLFAKKLSYEPSSVGKCNTYLSCDNEQNKYNRNMYILDWDA